MVSFKNAKVFIRLEQMAPNYDETRYGQSVQSVNLRLGFISHRYKGFLKDCPSGNLNETVSILKNISSKVRTYEIYFTFKITNTHFSTYIASRLCLQN